MQLRHLAERAEHNRGLLLKARQFGFTTLYCIDYLDESLWVPGSASAILGHDRTALDEIFQIIKRAFINLPDAIKPITNTDTKRMYRFTHRFDGYPLDSSIYVAMKLRSGTVQNLHITESAYIRDRQELSAGSKQAVPLTGRITEETTANGMNDFYDSYDYYDTKATPEPMDYKTYFYAWWENPEYTLPGQMPEILPEDVILYGDEKKERERYNLTDGQLLWRRWKIRELRTKAQEESLGLSPLQLFKQEYPANKLEAFQSGLGNVFDSDILNLYEYKEPLNKVTVMQDSLAQEYPKLVELFNKLVEKGVWIYHLPKPNYEYVVGVDPSDGTPGGDNGAISVRMRSQDPTLKVEQCAQFEGNMRPDELGDLAIEVAEFYNHAFLGVENNMLTCILHVSKNYDNYYSTVTIDEKTQKVTKKIGWTTSGKTRDPMIDAYVKLFEEQDMEIVSKKNLAQMRTFIKKEGGKREHADGKHDDVLFSDMICVQMLHYRKPTARAFSTKAF